MTDTQPLRGIGQGDSFPQLLWNTAHALGDAVAIREKHFGIWQEVSWREYLWHVRRFSLGLVALGLKRGDPVAIQAENCQEWLYSDLGIQCAGGIVTTVYPTSSTKEVRHILENAGARFVISGDQEHLDKSLELHAQGVKIERIIVFDPKGTRAHRGGLILSFKDVEELGAALDAEHPGRFESLVFGVGPDDVYDIMYTSGTSGLPKGAMSVQRGAIGGARAMLKALPFNHHDSWLSYLPLSHAFERIMAIAVHLCTGYVVNFADSIDTVQTDIVEIQPTVFGAVPRIIEKMKTGVENRVGKASLLKRTVYRLAISAGLRRVARQRIGVDSFQPVPAGRSVSFGDVKPVASGWRIIDRVVYLLAYAALYRPLRKHIGLLRARYVLCGAAPMSAELFQYFMALGVPITNAFGMTELHNIPCASQPKNYVCGTVGYVLPDWEIMKTAEGELLFRGPVGFLAYRGQEQESDRYDVKDAQGWLHTGDLGEIYSNGYVTIIGRRKDVIITSGGKNISPEFIENKLKASRYISEAVIIGEGRHYLTALIELDADTVGDYFQKQGIAYTTLRDLAGNTVTRCLLQGEIDSVNATLARVETVKKFAIIPRDLSHDDGELTATRKVKRAYMESQFRELIDEMYRDDAAVSAAQGRGVKAAGS